MKEQYELTFYGAAMARYFPRYKRWHPTLASAEATIRRVANWLQDMEAEMGSSVNSSGLMKQHDATIYGPGLGQGKRYEIAVMVDHNA